MEGYDHGHNTCAGRGQEQEWLCLYRLKQPTTIFDGEIMPSLNVKVEVLDYENCSNGEPFANIELRNVDGRLTLVGDVLGDDMRGWALVCMAEDKASSQKVVTRCSLNEQYLTDEAFERAAESYGGLTKDTYLTPDRD